ncbi:hypothetical protein G6M17_16025 [Agrobacterium tumefaciens]|uniref:Uncharacterized protein n=1 Tax=Agrobacterium tumefaciens TaxID=358 RepID=A0A546Y1V4_AGRTU|nr:MULTISPECIES: hypothetical protein [Rhizobium/Agrobacterium group]AXO68553.1 hypothetical protein B0909_26640 [Rhizobium rhizogenes]MCZ7444480.1 hypothetical protein [Rhizobium rhizogenes]NSZ80672.1 hypothetical protein [Agrobacterium tumefaciens]TRB06985.1 hypothetical protein EXN61_07555 [Agrobacterium tumefaciens]
MAPGKRSTRRRRSESGGGLKDFEDILLPRCGFLPLFCRFCAAVAIFPSLFLGETRVPGKKIPANMSNFICIAAILLRRKKI